MNDESRDRRVEKTYRTLWRWHFYSGLIFAPVLIVLATTGALYVFRDEIDRWRYDDIVNSKPNEHVAPLDSQYEAAQAEANGAHMRFARVFKDDTRATEFRFVDGEGRNFRVYVEPGTGETLGRIEEDQDHFWRIILSLHRRLGSGDFGRLVVELATSWGIALVLSGVYIWWPRSRRGASGAWYPRIRSGFRVFLRDIHTVSGIYISLFMAMTMFTGLFFTKYFRPHFASTMEMVGLYPEGDKRAEVYSRNDGDERPISIGALLGAVERHPEVSRPFSLFVPSVRNGVRDPNRAAIARVGSVGDPSLRFGMYFDQYSARNLGIIDRWEDMSWVRRLVVSAYPIHVGSIFGLPTKLLALAVCACLIGLSVTGVVMWWLRRPRGGSGWIKKRERFRISKGVIYCVCVLGLVFPVFGGSLILIALIEYFGSKCAVRVNKWRARG